MQEIWKDIKGYEGLYQVSNKGKVRSLNYRNTGVVKEIYIGAGKRGKYLHARLSKNGENKMFSVHRLVANAFIPNPYEYRDVNHKDEITVNNSVENLEWCTHRYNLLYGYARKKMATTLMATSPKNKPVSQFQKDGTFIRSYRSQKEAERETGISSNCISSCCLMKKNYNTAGGYQWCFCGEEHKIRVLRNREIKQYTLGGEFVRAYKNQSEARKILGIGDLSAACNKIGVSCNGFLWCYSGEERHIKPRRIKVVKQFDLNGNCLNTFKTVSEAGERSKIRSGYIADCCAGRNRRKTAGGYIWKYEYL